MATIKAFSILRAQGSTTYSSTFIMSPASSHPSYSPSEGSRVLFNERSNRLEPYSSHPNTRHFPGAPMSRRGSHIKRIPPPVDIRSGRDGPMRSPVQPVQLFQTPASSYDCSSRTLRHDPGAHTSFGRSRDGLPSPSMNEPPNWDGLPSVSPIEKHEIILDSRGRRLSNMGPPPLSSSLKRGTTRQLRPAPVIAAAAADISSLMQDLSFASIAEVQDEVTCSVNLPFTTILDSGTTVTLVKDISFFHTYSTDDPVDVLTANHGVLRTTGRGTCIAWFTINHRRLCIRLTNCLHAPNALLPHISTGRLFARDPHQPLSASQHHSIHLPQLMGVASLVSHLCCQLSR